VIPYFERFMERFPDVRSLAEAELDEVLARWSGLGYYRRARSLHKAARQIVERGGEIPRDVDGLMELPGIGRYTAGAIASIAHGQRVPILDGNVTRVLSRMFVLRGDPTRAENQRELWRLAELVLPDRRLSEFNQALMELGALVCRSTQPRCLVCPWRDDCGAHRAGVEEELPELRPKAKVRKERWSAGVVRKKEAFLFFKRRDRIMQDLWELPGGTCRAREPLADGLVREARERYGVRLRIGRELTRIRHSIMNRRITVHAFEADVVSGTEGSGPMQWIDRSRLADYPMSSMTLKVFRTLED